MASGEIDALVTGADRVTMDGPLSTRNRHTGLAIAGKTPTPCRSMAMVQRTDQADRRRVLGRAIEHRSGDEVLHASADVPPRPRDRALFPPLTSRRRRFRHAIATDRGLVSFPGPRWRSLLPAGRGKSISKRQGVRHPCRLLCSLPQTKLDVTSGHACAPYPDRPEADQQGDGPRAVNNRDPAGRLDAGAVRSGIRSLRRLETGVSDGDIRVDPACTDPGPGSTGPHLNCEPRLVILTEAHMTDVTLELVLRQEQREPAGCGHPAGLLI